MSNRTVGCAVLRFGALTIAAMLAFGGVATTALAQEADPSAPVSTSPTETTTPPPTTSEPPAPTSAPAPPATTEPEPTEEPKPTETPEPPKPPEPPAKAEVAAETGNVNVVVFADANRNGVLDQGEALKDVRVALLKTAGDYVKYTDASGRASFTGIPVGRYKLYYELPGGWIVHMPTGGTHVTVEANKTAELTAAAQRPYRELFTATASFDQSTYAYPATARIWVTLTNTGGYALSGIQASCTQTALGYYLGHGPEWDVLRGNGVALAVGEQRTIVINEAVPAGARDWGEASLLCNFAPDAADNYGVSVSADVKVTGGKGKKSMLLVDDKNKNWRFDDGEAISGTTVTLRDTVSGAEVASLVSGADGKVEFRDVPVGSYHAVASSPWSFTVGGAPYEVYVWEPGSATTTNFMYPEPTSKAALRTTLEFDKPNYFSYETMRMKFTITNAGTQAAEQVRLPWELIGNPREDITDYGPLKPRGPGLRLEPGETKTVVAVSPIRDWRPEPQTLKLEYYLEYIGRKDNREDWFSGSTVITFVEGDVKGVLYGDRNHNGQQDPGEALAGAEVTIGRPVPRYMAKRTTDAEGRFLFEDAPAGDWNLSYRIEGWTVPDDPAVNRVHVTPGGVDLVVRAERSARAVLHPTTTFDKSSYQPGEQAKLMVKLVNASDRPITGITAACTSYDKSYLDVGPEWGALAPGAGGVSLGAGETKTITVVEEVPQGALELGELQSFCRFGPGADREYDLPTARAWASVPGAFGSVNVRLYHDKNENYRVDDGEGISNARVVLRTWFSGADVIDGVPDAHGQLKLPRVPAGPYKASIDGQWKFADENQDGFKVVADRETSRDIRLVPDATKQPWPPVPGVPQHPEAPAGPGGAAPQPPAKVVLAKTGASVLGIGLAGALLVAFGVGARTASRNREAQVRGRA